MPITSSQDRGTGPVSVVEIDVSDPNGGLERQRLMFAVEFGATSSTVAYVIFPADRPPQVVESDHVRCIDIDHSDLQSREVSTVSSYHDRRRDIPNICTTYLTHLPETHWLLPTNRIDIVQSALERILGAKMPGYAEASIRHIYTIPKSEATAECILADDRSWILVGSENYLQIHVC
jgi:hypothetical protein